MITQCASVVLRFHHGASLRLLQDALCSLATQTYQSIELVVAGQNLDALELTEIQSLCDTYLKPRKIRVQLHNLKMKKGVDGRARLLSLGIQASQGQYLSFLDYDDILYPDAIQYLIGELKKNPNCVLAAGLCMRADLQVKNRKAVYIKSKEPFLPHKDSILDLYVDNFLPIHSFVINKKVCKPADLKIDEKFLVREDYYLLLNLSVKYPFCLTSKKIATCEYRFRDDQTNTTPVWKNKKDKRIQIWLKNSILLENFKKTLHLKMSLSELSKGLIQSMQVWAKEGEKS